MADLWQAQRDRRLDDARPLAERMRPRTLDEFVGQAHVLGPGKLLRRLIAADALASLILFGPPGTGKTTLAQLIAHAAHRHFEREHAAAVGVARIREILDQAQRRLALEGRKTILFLDEIHRFSRSQQDVLLHDVERGVVALIGATTENPLFSVNPALVSRSTLVRLEPLAQPDVVALLRRAAADPDRGFGRLRLDIRDEAYALWARLCDGDARRALTALEVAVRSAPTTPDDARPIPIDLAVAEDSIQQKAPVYHAHGDEHYDAASALIKAVRGSDPDAALYWAARMLEAGEDPRFLMRRLAILASEDIGNADPRAIMIAASAWTIVERLGMPEARITLAHCITYLALAPKSNAAYAAIEAALHDVRHARSVPVPDAVKDRQVKHAAARAAHHADAEAPPDPYAYAHTHGAPSHALGRIGTQDALGTGARYYHPTDHGAEKILAQRLDEARAARDQSPPA